MHCQNKKVGTVKTKKTKKLGTVKTKKQKKEKSVGTVNMNTSHHQCYIINATSSLPRHFVPEFRWWLTTHKIEDDLGWVISGIEVGGGIWVGGGVLMVMAMWLINRFLIMALNKKEKKEMNDKWQTPPHIYHRLNNHFHFDAWDPCPIDWDKSTHPDALNIKWKGNTIFVNPPYSIVGKFVKKAYEEWKDNDKTVVMLINNSTESNWFRDYVAPHAEVTFVTGRIWFLTKEGLKVGCNPRGSMIVQFLQPGIGKIAAPIQASERI